MATIGFIFTDFRIFDVDGFSRRMEQIHRHIRPKLLRLGGQIAPELGMMLRTEFFPHVARHARQTVNPPSETWVAFGTSARGYKREAHFALCVSRFGIHARVIVARESDHRRAMAARLRDHAAELAKSFDRTRLERYDSWDFTRMPPRVAADRALFETLSDELTKKAGGINVGFGWPVREALTLERAELLDAYRELVPLYRTLCIGL
ncbi:MAG: DUF1054 family protein [Candidatus Binataceae bacterium]